MIEFIFAYGLLALYFFLFILLLSLSDKEVSEKERYLTAIGLSVIWPITLIWVGLWEFQQRGKE